MIFYGFVLDRINERKFTRQEAIDFVLKHRKPSLDGLGESASVGSTNVLSRTESSGLKLVNSGAEFNASNATSGASSIPNIYFVVPEKEKLTNWKRRHESHVSFNQVCKF